MEVVEMYLKVTNLDEIYAVFPHIHLIGIKKVHVQTSPGNQCIVLSEEDMDRLGNLPEWKTADCSVFFGDPKVRLLSSDLMRHVIVHINGGRWVHSRVITVHLRDVLFMKKIMGQKRNDGKRCELVMTFETFLEEQRFRQMLDPVYFTYDRKDSWLFNIQDSSAKLRISMKGDKIKFIDKPDNSSYDFA